MNIRLERKVNLGNYEMYTISVSDDFEGYTQGLKIMKSRIDEALKLVGADHNKPRVTVKK